MEIGLVFLMSFGVSRKLMGIVDTMIWRSINSM